MKYEYILTIPLSGRLSAELRLYVSDDDPIVLDTVWGDDYVSLLYAMEVAMSRWTSKLQALQSQVKP